MAIKPVLPLINMLFLKNTQLSTQRSSKQTSLIAAVSLLLLSVAFPSWKWQVPVPGDLTNEAV